jgi:hypothetical protein
MEKVWKKVERVWKKVERVSPNGENLSISRVSPFYSVECTIVWRYSIF